MLKINSWFTIHPVNQTKKKIDNNLRLFIPSLNPVNAQVPLIVSS